MEETQIPAPLPAPAFDLASGIGRSQAFSLVATQCAAAQAVAMRQIRESEAYKTTGLTWEDFCPTHFGITRRRVEGLIDALDEFGEAYFRLCEIVHVSPRTFRLLRQQIKGENIEIQGELVPIAPENAPRIREAVAAQKPQGTRRQSAILKPGYLDNAVLYHFRKRMIGWTRDVRFLFDSLKSEADRAELLQMLEQQMFYLGEELCEMDKTRRSLPGNRQ